MEVIAHVRNGFPAKFGLPRQSGLVDAVESLVVFEPRYRVAEALRGLEGYSHIWLLWDFHQARREPGGWSPTVRPPRLGGNARMGVFATRSPFRPNGIGLSCVRLVRIEETAHDGLALRVAGADMMDGTPVYDIKPYLPYVDCHPEAVGGFAAAHVEDHLDVECPPALLERIPSEQREAVLGLLAQDPRPAYQQDPERVYGFVYAGMEIRFTVSGGVLHVRDVREC